MTPRVKYDFDAAARLSSQLSQLASKLEWLAWLRDRERSTLLGSPRSDNWKGKRRDRFEQEFRREQSRLKTLAEEAREMKSKVDAATANAHAAQKATH
jgi:outer membrane murein-binding lipoprotein Lpp